MNNHLKDKFVVKEAITQQGIQFVLDCDISLVSRLLKKNENNGYIYRSLLKIENKKRKQYAYFLTSTGLNFAWELQNRYPNLKLEPANKKNIQKCLQEF